jgi:multiple sugar transport system permease protein
MNPGTRRRLRAQVGDGVVRLGLAIFTVWTLAPIAWMVLSSAMKQRALTATPPRFAADSFTLGNYREVIGSGHGLGQAMVNSAIVALCTTAIALALGSSAAYAIARLSIPGGNRILLMVLATQMFPGITLIIPLFIVLSRAKLVDTHLGLILVYLSFVLPIVIWILKGFFEAIPLELEKAATVDGATTFQIFRLVVLPISLPPLFACAIFAFIESWNEFLFAVILTRLQSKTVPVVISDFTGQYQSAFGQMIAAATIASLPVILLAILTRRYILLGFAEGALKG